MDFLRTDLDTGVTVVTESMPSVRSAAIGFWVRIGSRDEGGQGDGRAGDDTGASHFLEHLLFKGTGRRTAKDIAAALDAVGGDLNAFTSKEYTCYYARVLDRDLPVAVDVLSDMLADATVADQDVEQERHVVLEEINIHLDTPEDLVHSDFAEVVLRGHPLAREVLGTAESISAMSRDRVHGYYQRYYRPANLTVAAAGNLDHQALLALVEAMTGDLARPGGERPRRRAPERYGAGEVKVRGRPTEQAHVVLGVPGLRRDDDRRFTLMVTNSVLGGGMSARLFQEVREQRGLAYSTYSYHASYADAGYFGAYAGTTPAKVDELLKVVRGELDRLVDTVDASEVERAKGNVKGSMVLSLEDTGSRMTRLGKMLCTESELLSVDEAIRRVDAVDLDAVREVGRQLLNQPRCLALVGPFNEEDRDRFLPYVA
ncbi:MAG TPA: pitrilysin family protein [Nitriliruptorales bacterium]|nr:pitrilysin family protein [Nitriliruptorales bacterium]